VRAAVLAAVVLVLASCKAGDSGSPVPRLQLSKASVHPYESLLISLGATVTDATLSGTLGSEPVTAARVNDSTFSLLIPPVASGSYELRLTAGGTAIASQISVVAAATIADPAATVDSVTSIVLADVATIEASFVPLASDGRDTVAIRQQLTALRAKIQSWRAEFAAASPEERRQVAAFFAANPSLSLSAFNGGGPGAGRATFAVEACQEGTECMGELEKTVRRLAVGMAVFAGGMIAAKAASWLGGLATKLTMEGVQIVAAGVLLGYVANGVADIIRTPVVPKSTTQEPGPQAVAAGPIAATFKVGTPGPITVTAEYSSLTSADLTTGPASALATAMKFFQDTWSTIASAIPFVSLPTPSFPASAARKVIAPIPPDQLSLTGVTPSDYTATAFVQGDVAMLTFSNPKAGADHDVNLAIKFNPPGFPEQTFSRTVRVRPNFYSIESIVLSPSPLSVWPNDYEPLTAVLRDSTGAQIPVSAVQNIPGLFPIWTSSDESIATVGGSFSDGLVHGSSVGTATVTLTIAGKKGQATVNVEYIAPPSHYSGTASVSGLIGNIGDCQYSWALMNTLVTVDYDPAPPEGETVTRSVTITMSGTATREASAGSSCPTSPMPFSATFTGTATGINRTFNFESSQTVLGWNLFIPQGGVGFSGIGENATRVAGGRIRFSPGYGGQQPELAFQIPPKP
jgi:hypothetical protein